MEFEVKENCLYIYPSGRIDSTNAPNIEQEIKEIRENNPASNLVLDVDNLQYISSAGLRIVLGLRKLIPTLKVINASSEIYDIFEMTGFTEMITVEKAFRKLSVEGCEVIGQGANGKVYRLDPDTIIKVYLNPDSLPEIKRERELARRAFVLGIPTAIPYDVVRVGNGYGSVFELLAANPFSKLVHDNPEDIDKYVNMSIELLKKIHSTTVKEDDMPNEKDVVVDWAKFLVDYLPEAESTKLCKMVDEIPVVHTMMHGDYHVKNVMYQNGESLLIDMDTLCWGHPIFEFASMYNAYIAFNEQDEETDKPFLGISFDLARKYWEKSLELYFPDKSIEERKQIELKAATIGYARIVRRAIRRHALETIEGTKKVNYYKDKLIDCINKVDNLLF